jgi:hypothetical protein
MAATLNAAEGEQQTQAPGDTAMPVVLPLKLTLEPTPLPARKPLFQSLQSNMRSMLSLHNMIETTPLVVGGITVYVEAEAIATRQRIYNPSRLTVGLAPDRVVLCGSF